jgi:hypothetical protein
VNSTATFRPSSEAFFQRRPSRPIARIWSRTPSPAAPRRAHAAVRRCLCVDAASWVCDRGSFAAVTVAPCSTATVRPRRSTAMVRGQATRLPSRRRRPSLRGRSPRFPHVRTSSSPGGRGRNPRHRPRARRQSGGCSEVLGTRQEGLRNAGAGGRLAWWVRNRSRATPGRSASTSPPCWSIRGRRTILATLRRSPRANLSLPGRRAEALPSYLCGASHD